MADSPRRRKKAMEGIKQILSFKIHKSQIKPGDHIYSWRKAWLYSHHGIYIGDDMVIHFTWGGSGQEIGTGTVLDRILVSSSPSNSGDPCLKCGGDRSDANGVIASCLDCFLSGGNLYLYRYSVSPPMFLAKVRGGTCTLADSDPPKDVILRAKFLLENGFGSYNILTNNSEDFALYCKTGIVVFTPIIFTALPGILFSKVRDMTSSFPILAVVGCGMYCITRYVADIGGRRDVKKISVEELVGSIAEPHALIQTALESHTQVTVERLEVAQASVEELEVVQALDANASCAIVT